ncbi:DUF3486 family protein [Desulfatibacillum aliphaticivorans]|uniref:DUF3486 family protein n=1 Tax=Desulfatibacillum aliphaticivorans TaxID=218208 RepID=UPI0003F72F6A|nr:DUF3486 family protein [Desulfatibacillum aliphaticivorans]
MGHAKIRKRSRIETELPRDLREELHRILLEGATYEEACQYCKDRGHDISRSSMGRYGKTFFEAYQAVKQFEDQAQALKSEVGEGLTLEEATSKMMLQKVMAGLVSGEADILEIPRLISDVAKLQASSVAREKLKADLAARVKKVAGEVADAVKKSGLSDDAADKIKRKILGIAN